MASGLALDVNVGNEQVVVGALIHDPVALRREVPTLPPETFCYPAHRDLMTALRALTASGGTYAADTVIQLSGGTVTLKYLRELEAGYAALPEANLALHLRKLRDDAAKFSAGEPFGRLYDLLDDHNASRGDTEAAALEVVRRLRAGRGEEDGLNGRALAESWSADLAEAVAGRGDRFRPLGFTGLDEQLYEGLRPGRVIVLAGRPGMGKSTMISNLCLRQERMGRRVLCCPLEDGRQAVLDRIACARARVPAEKLVKDPTRLTPEERVRMDMVVQRVLSAGLLVFEDAISSLDELELRVEGAGFHVVVLDLFEYLIVGEVDAATVTADLRRFRKMARRHGFAGVVVQQIRRIKRVKSPRPTLTDLKNSGGYEEVADLVLLLHRNKYYDPDAAEDDVIEVNIAKQRRGPQNLTCGFEFQPDFCRVGKHTEDFDGNRRAGKGKKK